MDSAARHRDSDLSGLQIRECGHITSLSKFRVVVRIGRVLCSGKHNASAVSGITVGRT